MNIKRTFVSAVAALGLAASVMTPTALAQETNEGNTTVNEAGAFGSLSLWGTDISFGTAEVDTINGDTLIKGGGGSANPYQVFTFEDTRASSPGWTIQMTATDFSDGNGHLVENENLSVNYSAFNSSLPNSCAGNHPPTPPNPTNPFQTPTLGTTPATLDSAVTIVSADAGRGCGDFWINLGFELNVPAGTFTGGSSTTYTSQITVSEVGAP